VSTSPVNIVSTPSQAAAAPKGGSAATFCSTNFLKLRVNAVIAFPPAAATRRREAEYDRFLGIILKGKFFAAQAAAKAMKDSGRGGAIVQTGSMWALQAIGATPSAAYSAAKAGVHALTKNLAISVRSWRPVRGASERRLGGRGVGRRPHRAVRHPNPDDDRRPVSAIGGPCRLCGAAVTFNNAARGERVSARTRPLSP
jgi:hypothetical protein